MKRTALLLAAILGLPLAAQQVVVPHPRSIRIPPDEIPVLRKTPQFRPALVEASNFIHADQARRDFDVTGAGLTAAVLDTGLFVAHADFKPRVPGSPRVPEQANFTADNGGKADDATDGFAHGSNVAGIIAANGPHRGIAFNARIVPIKVLDNTGGGTFDAIEKGLQFVIDHHTRLGITAVNLSLGDQQNYLCDGDFAADEVAKKIQTLRDLRIPVVVAAGNEYGLKSLEGMAFPAILRSTISVGALYDASVGGFEYAGGVKAIRTEAGQITPFSQRLHASLQNECQTDIFAPGAPITSTGLAPPLDESIQQGTSQAAPVVTGVILLMQEYYLRQTGTMPTVDELQDALRSGSARFVDADRSLDNVGHTNQEFRRLDAVEALQALQRRITAEAFRGLKAMQAQPH